MIYKIFYIIGINFLTFILMGWDKYCAKKNYWRISKSNLLSLALLGGGIGEFFGMVTFRHKTKKNRSSNSNYYKYHFIHLFIKMKTPKIGSFFMLFLLDHQI